MTICHVNTIKYTLEKAECAIKNGQEKLSKLGTHDTGRRQTNKKTQHRKLITIGNTDPTKNRS